MMARRSGVPAAVFREKNSNRRTVGGEISPIAPDFAYAFGHSIPPIIHLLFGPVTRTQCVHVAFCNTRRTHTVFLCVRHTSQLCKNRRTDRDAICATDSCGPRNLILDGGPDPPGEGNFEGTCAGPLYFSHFPLASACGE